MGKLEIFMGGAMFGAAIMGISTSCLYDGVTQPKTTIPKNDRPKNISVYDVNNDGLKDTILKDGSVVMQQSDGSYRTLKEMWSEESEQLRERYSVRKTADGKYTAGVNK